MENSALRQQLEAAASGLLYTSESDYPLEWYTLPGGATGWPYGVDEFAQRAGVTAEPHEERTLQRFFAPHIDSVDPSDGPSMALKPRFEALRDLLSRSLREVRVFRLGHTEIACYVVGDDGAGNLAGLRTTAVET